MNSTLALVCSLGLLAIAQHARGEGTGQPSPAQAVSWELRDGWVALPSRTTVQFRLCTTAPAEAGHLCNSFEIEAYGEMLLRAPRLGSLALPAPSEPSVAVLDNVLVEGAGPDAACTNGLAVLEHANGTNWSYLALDVSAAYRSRLTRFVRGILFVEPDLFILYDHLLGPKPVGFEMQLHLPTATVLDTNWGELHLERTKASLTVHSPGRRLDPRPWHHIASRADAALPGTITLSLGPTNRLAELHVVTVFAVHPGRITMPYRFKLLESSSTIGVQVHRDGLPTLVAFKTDATAKDASLSGFGFSGPVGVYVYVPKPRGPTAR